MKQLQEHFRTFREGIVGKRESIKTPFGEKPLIYADWTASGRLYRPIEEALMEKVGVYFANTHTESNYTGTMTTKAYHDAIQIIKRHVGATEYDVLVKDGSGMTGVINRFQRMLGLRIHEQWKEQVYVPEQMKPVVFLTHMEHHSNQTSWNETIADVVVVPPNEMGEVCPALLRAELQKYEGRPLIGSFTACSNVTGIQTPYHQLAAVMHEFGGICCVDFAASAPYVSINMHPEDPMEQLDAIFFSPHKFLGGPGTSGILVFNSSLYGNQVPDLPGGGTVLWTNPWGEQKYYDDIETREDGGTPAILQTIKTAFAIVLKERMGVENILEREHQLLRLLWDGVKKDGKLHVLDGHQENRLGIFSFYHEEVHHNLFVRLLNDLHGVQTRGGCSCAGTYGHYLLGIGKEYSKSITNELNAGKYDRKPGWVRVSLHPTMTDWEMNYIVNAINDIAENYETYKNDYVYDPKTNEFLHKDRQEVGIQLETVF